MMTPEVLQDHIKFKTQSRRQYLQHLVTAVDEALHDKRSEKRKRERLCKVCFYVTERSRIGGAALTSRDCDACGKTTIYPSTATDQFCEACSDKHEICKRCGCQTSI